MNRPPCLQATTVSIEAKASLVEALPDLPPDQLVSWVRGGQGFVGWGRAAAVSTSGPKRFADARRWWSDVARRADVSDAVNCPGTGLIAVGSFAYASGSTSGATLVVPEVIVGHRDGTWWCTRVRTRAGNDHPDAGPAAPPAVPLNPAGAQGREAEVVPGSLTEQEWAARVAQAVRCIDAGEVEKVVLARDEVIHTASPIDLRALLRDLAASYVRTWVFSIDGLVGATPEMLVRLEKGLVTSRVLAGTIRRTGDDAADLMLAATLARSSKDLEEHEYAVRSVADALRPHCSSMNVPEDPFVLHLPNVMHLASDVTGRLTGATDSLRLAEALHPSAAVCGTPRGPADALIERLEGMDRGRYAGPVGWTDANGDGEWGIALRCGHIEGVDATRMRVFAGCGIVAGSDPATEVAESRAKLLPMKNAFGL